MLNKIKESVDIKKDFESHYKKLLGEKEYERFMEYSLSFLTRCIRVNTLKISVEELKERLGKDWSLTPVPWCKEGFWIEHKTEDRRDIGNLREHLLGYFYVQEAASMIPPIALDPQPEETVLDMCSSPGSKSTQIAQYMENKGILICNDVKGIRLQPLGVNIQKNGVSNAVLTLMQGTWFKDQIFDRVLVDAPCSGIGTIRKSLKTLKIWNEKMISRLSKTQKNLIETGFNVLKENGVLVYSTCTVDPEEDEGVISYLLNKYPDARVEKIDIKINRSKPFLSHDGEEYNPMVKDCLRIWPQDNNTEGFFVTRIRKLPEK